jgi:hypothetical protein
MTTFGHISQQELVDDYYASKMDYETIRRLLPAAEIALKAAQVDGVSLEHASKTVDSLTKRLEGNQRIMNIIDNECQARGFVPPWRED